MKANSAASNGKTFDATKTEARTCTIPMGPTLREMFLNWREKCSRLNSEVSRVFPLARGKRRPWPKPRQGGGGPLLYSNVWKPFLAKLALPEVTPHSARHAYISNLQAAGIEVATVAAGRPCEPGNDARRVWPRPARRKNGS
jgi:integrase